MACSNAAFTINVMNAQSTVVGPGQRIVTAARGLAAPAGLAGLGEWTRLMGWPVWPQLTILVIAAVLGATTAVNSAIAHGRRQQSIARRTRISTDDHAYLVAARRKVLTQLAKPGLSRRRRRDLERTLHTLTWNQLNNAPP